MPQYYIVLLNGQVLRYFEQYFNSIMEYQLDVGGK